MKFEHILNMEYSLKDVFHLFWLLKEHNLPLPTICYLCDYRFLDIHNYFLEINEQPMTNQLERRLQEHLKGARYICEIANHWEANNIELYASFSHSSNPYNFYYLETDLSGKDKSAKYRLLTFTLRGDLDTCQPKWEFGDELFFNEKERKKRQENFKWDFEEKFGKQPTFYKMSASDIIKNLLEIIRQLYLYMGIKDEHPHKNIIDSLIPKHVNGISREELEHIFSNGKYNTEKVKWMSGYNGLQEYLRPHFDNKTIPNNHYQNWCHFAIENFTQKDGSPLKLKSLQNAVTRQNWASPPPNSPNSRTPRNSSRNNSRNVPETLPNISIKVGGDVSINLKQDTYNF